MAVEFQRSHVGDTELRSALVVLLFRHDPIQIGYETNWEEYAPEAENILARLCICLGPQDVCRVVYEELVRSFGTEAVGSEEECGQIAHEAWQIWVGLGPTH